MHPTITALKKRIRGEKGDTGITISKLTGCAALFHGGRGEKNVSSVLLLSDSPSEWGGLVRSEGKWQREGARGVITAMLRPERGRDLYPQRLDIHRKVGMEGQKEQGVETWQWRWQQCLGFNMRILPA